MPSPFLGPATWEPVAERLRVAEGNVLIPVLEDDGGSPEPFWAQHAASVAGAVGDAGAATLVAHSGAGPLLPAIGEAVGGSPAAYVFVDALVPGDGLSRLDLLARVSPEAAEELGLEMGGGRQAPSWTDDQLAGAVPDPAVRRNVLSEMRPRERRFFEEPIPVPEGWPDAPTGYLQLSAFYGPAAADARSRGWPVRVIQADHLHTVVDPAAVAGALTDLLEAMRG